ncbi:TRAP transporter small permease subunit [Ciceribacter ferrooxidans]|uniref:TRAP transporter small permease protein n=1 Tax=Ciceribacter ferrooxidans TaxID=2509717 RepID=A0A4Q2S2N4_9HYPH|nr:TRAP transporter small permease [Ciceribacter ferrooxidans]RYB95970.1 TRAP transporter small permease [Ciceribacter ferrooxidans]
MLKAYVTAVGNASRGLAIVATALVITSMLVICQMIAMRYVLRQPTIWQTDFVVFSATAAMFLGAPYVLLRGGHVGVDVVEMIVGDRTRAVLRVVASLLGLLFCVIMLIATWIQFHDAWAGNWKHSSVWAPPLWVPLSTLPVSFAMLCLQYVAQLLTLLTVLRAPVTSGQDGGDRKSAINPHSREITP